MRLIGATAIAILLGAGIAFALTRSAPQPAPRCGTVITRPGPVPDPGSLNCLYEAFNEGRLTEARTIRYTVEGDPITYELKIVLARKRIEVTVDSKDHFGPKGTFSYVCEGIERVPEPRESVGYRIVLTECWESHGFMSGGRIVP